MNGVDMDLRLDLIKIILNVAVHIGRTFLEDTLQFCKKWADDGSYTRWENEQAERGPQKSEIVDDDYDDPVVEKSVDVSTDKRVTELINMLVESKEEWTLRLFADHVLKAFTKKDKRALLSSFDWHNVLEEKVPETDEDIPDVVEKTSEVVEKTSEVVEKILDPDE